MLDKCEEGARYIHRKQFESALVPNGFSEAYARLDAFSHVQRYHLMWI